jgi:hypothetical protein
MVITQNGRLAGVLVSRRVRSHSRAAAVPGAIAAGLADAEAGKVTSTADSRSASARGESSAPGDEGRLDRAGVGRLTEIGRSSLTIPRRR